MQEIDARIDVGAVALELHQLLWSQSWTAPVQGREAAARAILHSVWQRLSAMAIDPTATLPAPSEIFVPRAAAEDDDMEDIRSDQGLPTWKMALERTDPLYYAFLRHEIMGDPRTFVSPPEVTEDDRARAERFKNGNGSKAS